MFSLICFSLPWYVSLFNQCQIRRHHAMETISFCQCVTVVLITLGLWECPKFHSQIKIMPVWLWLKYVFLMFSYLVLMFLNLVLLKIQRLILQHCLGCMFWVSDGWEVMLFDADTTMPPTEGRYCPGDEQCRGFNRHTALVLLNTYCISSGMRIFFLNLNWTELLQWLHKSHGFTHVLIFCRKNTQYNLKKTFQSYFDGLF